MGRLHYLNLGMVFEILKSRFCSLCKWSNCQTTPIENLGRRQAKPFQEHKQKDIRLQQDSTTKLHSVYRQLPDRKVLCAVCRNR